MILDHIGIFFFPDIMVLRSIGRVAMPLFCFFAGYNVIRPKYIVLIGAVWLLIVEYVLYVKLELNILFGIFLGQAVLSWLDWDNWPKDLKTFLFFILALASIFTFGIVEYGFLPINFMICGKLCKKRRRYQDLLTLSFLFAFIFEYLTFSFPPSLLIFTIILLGFCFVALRDYKQLPIAIDLSLISRYSLMIYCTHLTLLQMLRSS